MKKTTLETIKTEKNREQQMFEKQINITSFESYPCTAGPTFTSDNTLWLWSYIEEVWPLKLVWSDTCIRLTVEMYFSAFNFKWCFQLWKSLSQLYCS